MTEVDCGVRKRKFELGCWPLRPALFPLLHTGGPLLGGVNGETELLADESREDGPSADGYPRVERRTGPQRFAPGWPRIGGRLTNWLSSPRRVRLYRLLRRGSRPAWMAAPLLRRPGAKLLDEKRRASGGGQCATELIRSNRLCTETLRQRRLGRPAFPCTVTKRLESDSSRRVWSKSAWHRQRISKS
jgi:hypothetical protein